MLIAKKLLILTSITGFLFVLISFVTPGWLLVHVDIIKMVEYQLQSAPVEIQDQHKMQQKWIQQHHLPTLSNFDTTVSPFYVRYCLQMNTSGITTRVCAQLLPTDILALMKSYSSNETLDKNSGFYQAMQKAEENGIPMKYIPYVILAIIVVSSLVLIQTFVSLLLVGIYTFKKYPRNKLGIAGGISLIVSGAVCCLYVIVYLSSYTKDSSQIPDSMTDIIELGFPYSTLLCIIGSLLFFISAFLLIRITMKSKEPFKYEMMVIDTSRGGSTYVANT